MDNICDLHVHSTFSDGTLSPEELISLASDLKICALALCDHNTIDGLPAFLEAAEGTNVQAVPGIEFSSDYNGVELHILGLFIMPQHYSAVKSLMKDMLDRKERSNVELCEALTGAGLSLDYAHIKAGTPGGQVNRAVIAAEMVRLGYCESVKQAFSRWLSPKRGFYKPPVRLKALEVIRFIKSIGSVAVLAHPFLNLDERGLRLFLCEAIEQGLDGMEVYYPLFDDKKTALAWAIAEEFGLLKSGGSDFHGANKPDIQMGSGKGNLAVPVSIVRDLMKRCESHLG